MAGVLAARHEELVLREVEVGGHLGVDGVGAVGAGDAAADAHRGAAAAAGGRQHDVDADAGQAAAAGVDPALDPQGLAAVADRVGQVDGDGGGDLGRIDGTAAGIFAGAEGVVVVAAAAAGPAAVAAAEQVVVVAAGGAVAGLLVGLVELALRQAADVTLELGVALAVLLGLRERILGARAVEGLVLGVLDLHAQRGATEIDALPAPLGEPHLDEGVGLVGDVAGRDAERVRGDHEA